jgi:dienelactone hydrolase
MASRRLIALICATAGWVAATTASAGAFTAPAFNPQVEAQNFSKTQERATIYETPQYQALLRQVGAQNQQAALAMQAADPEREFVSDLCWNGYDGCAGDVRLYDWQAKGYGIVQPVLFTARNGATLSGHVWATKAGPAKRPGIVITNGSVQADEQLYWFVAQTLAKAGYVVLTWDPQGQGQSDTQGEAPDQSEGTPAQSDGRPFFDGTEDALNFLVSSPQHPYEPVKSCSSGTSHAPKQDRRVKAGLDAAYNPFWQLLDSTRLGLAGHSYGAAGVSYIGQWDPRVKAIVAFDNLGAPDPSTKTGASGGGPSEQPCPSNPGARSVPPITKPALGLSADYFLPPTPNTSTPDPAAKSTESVAYTKAGVDTGEIIIRGGSHLDFDWIPNPGFGATLRGADEIDWYTSAWFDKYLKRDPGADARLLTNRWRHDGQEAAIDPNNDGNMFSFYYPSRLNIGLAGGGRFHCEDIRPGCPGLSDADGFAGSYDFITLDRSPDGAAAAALPSARGLVPTLCATAGKIAVRAPRARGLRVKRLTVWLGSRRLASVRGATAHVKLLGLPRGRALLTLRVTATRNGHAVRRTLRRSYRTCR